MCTVGSTPTLPHRQRHSKAVLSDRFGRMQPVQRINGRVNGRMNGRINSEQRRHSSPDANAWSEHNLVMSRN